MAFTKKEDYLAETGVSCFSFSQLIEWRILILEFGGIGAGRYG